MSIADGRVFTQGNRANEDIVYAFDAATGRELWRHAYACPLDAHYYEGGTSATPTVDEGRVYSLSRKGHVFCLQATNGAVLWQKNLSDELGFKSSRQTPTWGYAGSPLVQGELVIVNVGTAGTALNKTTGQLIWRTDPGRAGYASPVPLPLPGVGAVAVLGATALHAVNVADGKILWSYAWKTSHDVNAADPVVSGDRILVSSGYGHGAVLLEYKHDGARKLWENKELRNQLSASVLLDGYLYGFDGNNGDRGANLRCVEFATGAVKWSEKSVKPGGLMAAGDKLIALDDGGELLVVQANPREFLALTRAQVLGGKCWTTPVLSNGRIYCRNAKGDLVCVAVGQVKVRAH
jgi:outer membrane protein assembly factor BamB